MSKPTYRGPHHRGTDDEDVDGPRYVGLLIAELREAAATPRTFYRKNRDIFHLDGPHSSPASALNVLW